MREHFGGEMKDIVYSTTYLNEDLEEITINNEAHKFKYRESFFMGKDLIVLNTTFSLKQQKQENIKQKMNENLTLRKQNQPTDYPSAGSTFKRGEDYITAKLIDESGLKGTKIGGAMVSNKHAGFIVNTGNATAEDVLKLIELIKKTIKEKYDKDIILEIKILGN